MASTVDNPVSRPSFLSRPQARFFLFGLPLALGAGYLMATIQSRSAEASTPRTATKMFMAEIQPGASLRPRQGALITEPGRAQRFAVWSQAVYQGDVDQSTVEALIASERAESLEGNLRPDLRAGLAKHVFDTDQEVIQIGSQYFAEFERVAAFLQEGDDVVVIRTHPRQKDARWPEVEAMQQRKIRKEGLLSGEYDTSLAPSGWKGELGEAPLSYVFLAWKEWPILQRYREKNDLVLYQRVLQTRRWISAEYGRRGMKLFEN